MSETNPADGLRIVLFGSSGAGKTSLLGALAQASQTQRQTLGGELIDDSGRLAELQKRTHENHQRETLEEIVTYPLTFQAQNIVPVTLIDCNGKLAQEFIDEKRSLNDRGLLADAIKGADALVLAVPWAEQLPLASTFEQLTSFFKLFEEVRGKRTEIGGFPIFLVLTKCDLGARPNDTRAGWEMRIEQNKKQMGDGFHEFLQHEQGYSFGKIDLHLGATGVKWPALKDSPELLQVPYSVAELFRQVFASAKEFHEQRTRSDNRVQSAVLGALVLVAVLGLLAAWFYWSRPSAEVAALENSIQAALPGPKASAAERLREPVEPKLKELLKFQDNPDFAQLPSSLQQKTRQAIAEMTIYQELAKQIDGLKRVRFFKKEEDIPSATRELDKIVLPKPYASEWADTRLVRKWEQYKKESAALSQALNQEKEWLTKQIEEGDRIPRMAIPAEGSPERLEWIKRADAFLKRKDFNKEVPNVPNMKLRDLYEFPTVNRLREDYEAVRPRVEKIRGGLTNS